eukprot:1862139-Rhodomonas_salina.2
MRTPVSVLRLERDSDLFFRLLLSCLRLRRCFLRCSCPISQFKTPLARYFLQGLKNRHVTTSEIRIAHRAHCEIKC